MADMAEVPSGVLYTEEHEYLLPTDDDGVYQVGITEYAQGELGDIVFVELPGEGEEFEQGDMLGTIEAVKAVSDLYSPVSGEVVEVNERLENDPSLVNRDPYRSGWMVILEVSDESELDELMEASEYEAHIEEHES